MLLAAALGAVIMRAPCAPGDTDKHGGNLARSAVVQVDSAFDTGDPDRTAFYPKSSLHDGVREFVGESGKAWASREAPTPHWMEFSWERPQTLATVVVFWSDAAGALFECPRRFEVQVWQGDEWRTTGAVANRITLEMNTVTFAPVRTQRLRIWAPAGGGSKRRPNIVWANEVEIYGPGARPAPAFPKEEPAPRRSSAPALDAVTLSLKPRRPPPPPPRKTKRAALSEAGLEATLTNGTELFLSHSGALSLRDGRGVPLSLQPDHEAFSDIRPVIYGRNKEQKIVALGYELRYVSHQWDGDVLAVTYKALLAPGGSIVLERHFAPREVCLDETRFVGFEERIVLDSPDEPVAGLRMGTTPWALGGTVDGTVYYRLGAQPNGFYRFEFDEETAQRVGQGYDMLVYGQGFELLGNEHGVLFSFFDDVVRARSDVRKAAGEPFFWVFNDVILGRRTGRIETPGKWRLFAPEGISPDLWLTASEFVRRHFCAKHDVPLPQPAPTAQLDVNSRPLYGNLHFYGSWRKYADAYLPMLKRLGFKRACLGTVFSTGHAHWPDLRVTDQFGGEAGLKDFCDRAHEAGIEVIIWQPTGIGVTHAGKGLDTPDVTKWYVHNGDGSVRCWQGLKDRPYINFRSGYLGYALERLRHLRESVGIDGVWLDSFLSAQEPDYLSDQPRPATEEAYRFLTELRRTLGCEVMVEAFSPLALHGMTYSPQGFHLNPDDEFCFLNYTPWTWNDWAYAPDYFRMGAFRGHPFVDVRWLRDRPVAGRKTRSVLRDCSNADEFLYGHRSLLPTVEERTPGGADAGMPGDAAAIVLANSKDEPQAAESVSLRFLPTEPIERLWVTVHYQRSLRGSSCTGVFCNGVLLGTFSARGTESLEQARFAASPPVPADTPYRVTVGELQGDGEVAIDALKIEADGGFRLIPRVHLPNASYKDLQRIGKWNNLFNRATELVGAVEAVRHTPFGSTWRGADGWAFFAFREVRKLSFTDIAQVGRWEVLGEGGRFARRQVAGGQAIVGSLGENAAVVLGRSKGGEGRLATGKGFAARAEASEVVFQAHFNGRLTPETGVARGDVLASNCGVTSGGLGYPFKDSRPAAEGLDMRKASARIEFPINEDVFNGAEGAAEFWYKHTLRPDLTKGCMVLFRVVFEGTGAPEHRFENGDQFLLLKADGQPSLVLKGRSAKTGISWRMQPTASVASWRRDEWRFIVLTWKGKQASIYLDGRLAAEGGIVPAGSKPRSILLGAEFWGHDPEGIYDELRLLSKALGPEQVLKHYEQGAVEKLEFPKPKPREPAAEPVVPATPIVREPLIMPYRPEEPKASAAGADLVDVNFPAVHIGQPPKLDGRLDDLAWQRAPAVTGLVRRGGKGDKAEVQTTVRFLYDEKRLYLGVRLDEPRMELLRQQVVDQHDQPVWRDDCFEFFFDTSGRADTFYHFAVNAGGTVADLQASRMSWSSLGTIAKTHKASDHWNIELAIPFEDLGVTPRYGEVWGARVCRERYAVPKGAGAAHSALPDVGRSGFSVYAKLGRLHFGAASEGEDKIRVTAVSAQRPFFGVNKFAYRAANLGDKAATIEFEARAVDAANMLLAGDRVTKVIAAGGQAEALLRLPVRSDSIQAVSVTAYDMEARRYVYGIRLPSAIATAAFSLESARTKLPHLQSNTALLPAASPVAGTVRESVARCAQRLAGFEQALAAAIGGERQLPEQQWTTFRRELAGFGAWLGRHRFVAWPDDLWANGLPTSFPADEAPLERLLIEMAGNERQATSFSLTGLAVPGRLDVQAVAVNLVCKENPQQLLMRENVHFYWAAPFRDELKKLVADPLVKTDGNIFTITTGATLKLWVIVSSEGVAPGTYEGEVVVRPLDTLETTPDYWRRIPLTVKVWPFVLPRTEDNPLQAYMWGGSGYRGCVPDPVEMVRDLYEHRVNWVMADWFVIANRSSEKRFSVFTKEDMARARTLFEQAKLRGMKVMFAWNSPKAEAVKGVVEYMRGLGFKDGEFASMSVKDEFGSKHVPGFLAYHRKVESLGVPMRFMCTYCAQTPPYGATHAEIEPLMDHIDIWLNHRGLWWPPSEDGDKLLALQRRHGVTIGAYQCSSPMRVAPLVDYFRLYPWQAWRMGVQLVAYWTYLGATRGDSDFWDVHYEKGFRGHGPSGMVYWSAGGRLNPSKRYEAFREGMEDYCYLWILNRRIAAARERGQDVAAAEKVLADSVSAALDAKTMETLETLRRRLAEQIMKLPRATD